MEEVGQEVRERVDARVPPGILDIFECSAGAAVVPLRPWVVVRRLEGPIAARHLRPLFTPRQYQQAYHKAKVEGLTAALLGSPGVPVSVAVATAPEDKAVEVAQ